MMFPLTIHNKILKFSLDFVFYFLKIPEVTPNVFQWEMAFKKRGFPDPPSWPENPVCATS